jgi:hypothetical protein
VDDSVTDSTSGNKLLKMIIDVLIKIADNTSSLSDIVKILTDTLDVKVPDETMSKIKNNKSAAKNGLTTILLDSAKNNKNLDNESILRTLEALASE